MHCKVKLNCLVFGKFTENILTSSKSKRQKYCTQPIRPYNYSNTLTIFKPKHLQMSNLPPNPAKKNLIISLFSV